MGIQVTQTSIQSSGEFAAGGLKPLAYVVLFDGLVLITQQSLFDYLEIDRSSLSAILLPPKLCIYYGMIGGVEQYGVPAMEVPALCINIIEWHAKFADYKYEAINAMMLLMFLASSELKKLVVSDLQSEKNTSAYIIDIHRSKK